MIVEIVAAIWMAWFCSYSMIANNEILKRLAVNEAEISEALDDVKEIKQILKTPRYRKSDTDA